jgi:hypothetical protein
MVHTFFSFWVAICCSDLDLIQVVYRANPYSFHTGKATCTAALLK